MRTPLLTLFICSAAFAQNHNVLVIVADDLSPSEIPAFLESRIARHMIPRFVQFAAEIPRTETEKIRREALKADRDGEIDLAGDTEYA